MLKERFPEYNSLDLVKYLRLKDNDSRFFFIHGYELDVLVNYEPLTIEKYERISENLCQVKDFLGEIMSGLWGLKNKLQKPPEERKDWRRRKGIIPYKKSHMDNLEKFACSKVRNIFLGMRKDEKLVFGHTHNPFIQEDTANAGSWVKDASRHNTFIEIKNGKMDLKFGDEV